MLSSMPIMKPSDISATRPLRSLFPKNSYVTRTAIDENTVEDEDSLVNDKSTSPQEDNNKLGTSLSLNADYVREIYTQGSRY